LLCGRIVVRRRRLLDRFVHEQHLHEWVLGLVLERRIFVRQQVRHETIGVVGVDFSERTSSDPCDAAPTAAGNGTAAVGRQVLKLALDLGKKRQEVLVDLRHDVPFLAGVATLVRLYRNRRIPSTHRRAPGSTLIHFVHHISVRYRHS
jgi:hypothetical protein